MEVLGKNRIKVKIGEIEKEILITFGKDIKLTEIFGKHMSEVHELIKQPEPMSEKVLSKLVNPTGEEELSSEQMEAAKEMMNLLNISENNAMTIVSDMALKIQNAKVQICAELLTEYDEVGNPTETVTATALMFSDKYADDKTIKELDELYAFAYNRFNKIIEEYNPEKK